MRAIVVAAGALGDPDRIRRLVDPRPDDLVICADGGAAHALALGLVPHLLLGDFDSLDPAVRARLAAQGVPVQQVPWDKDQTDTHLALQAALERGARELVLLGALGSRWDHSLANVLLLPGLPAGVVARVVDDHNVIHLVGPGGVLDLAGAPGERVSLLPLTPVAAGIWTEGLRWPLAGDALRWGESRGVSNEFLGTQARVRVEEGWLLVVQAWD